MGRADPLADTIGRLYRTLGKAAAAAAPGVAVGIPSPLWLGDITRLWPDLVAQLAGHIDRGWAVDTVKARTPRPSPSVVRREAVAAAEQHAARLVTAETDRVRGRIANLVADAMTDMARWPARLTTGQRFRPGSSWASEPFTLWLARQIEPAIGLNRRQERSLIVYRRQLLRELDTGQRAARRALEPARRRRVTSLADVDRAVARYSAQLRTYRARMIAGTESHAALMRGRRAAYEEMARNGRAPTGAMMEWVLVDDERLCERCAGMAGQMVPVLGGQFTDGDVSLPVPPLHPACRCGLRLVTR